MIAECPNCSTSYHLSVGTGLEHRTLRCTKCRHEWKATGLAQSSKPLVTEAGRLLVCPQCHLHYRINKSDVPAAGRTVRCNSCRYIWYCSPAPSPPPAAPINSGAEPALSHPYAAIASASSGAIASATPPYAHTQNHTALTTSWNDGQPAERFCEPHTPHADELLTAEPITAEADWAAATSHGRSTRLVVCLAVLLTTSAVLFNVFDHGHAVPKTNVTLQASLAPARSGYNMAPPPVTAGIGLYDVTFDRKLVYGLGTMITVHGSLENSADKELPLPKSIQLLLKGANQKVLYNTSFAPTVRTLGPHESIGFQTEVYDAPPGTTSLELALATTR